MFKSELKSANLSRAPRFNNWTQEMKETLRSFVEEYAEVVNSKENNAKMIELKKDAWSKIRAKMAAVGYNIAEKRLEETWTRMKGQSRMLVLEHKRGISATGGGETPAEPDEFHYRVLATDPAEAVEDIAEFDGDAQNINDDLLAPAQETIEEIEEKIVQEEIVDGRKKTVKSKAKEQQQDKMLRKRILQIEDEHEGGNKIRALQIEIEKKKLKVEDKRLEVENQRLEAIKEGQEHKRILFQKALKAEEAKEEYYSKKMSFCIKFI